LNNHNFYTKYQTQIEKSHGLHELYHGNGGELMVEYSSFAPQYQDPQLETQKWIVLCLPNPGFHQTLPHKFYDLPLSLSYSRWAEPYLSFYHQNPGGLFLRDGFELDWASCS